MITYNAFVAAVADSSGDFRLLSHSPFPVVIFFSLLLNLGDDQCIVHGHLYYGL